MRGNEMKKNTTQQVSRQGDERLQTGAVRERNVGHNLSIG